MKHLLLIALSFFSAISLSAQRRVATPPTDSLAAAPFNGHFYCAETDIHLVLDLYRQQLEAPGLSFLGKIGGYINGRGVYGTWMLTKSAIKQRTATLRFSNDVGSDAQTIEFAQLTDSTFHYKTIDGNAIKKAVNRKLEKLPGEMVFKRVK